MGVKNAKFFWGHTAATTPNTLLCSDSSQYAIIISQSLIRFFYFRDKPWLSLRIWNQNINDFLMIGLELSGYVHTKRVKWGKNSILLPLVIGTYSLIFCILSYYLYFLKNFKLQAKMLNFIFIEVTWKLGYLRRLNFVQEKWLRVHSSCIPAKWLICFRMWWSTFSQKMCYG